MTRRTLLGLAFGGMLAAVAVLWWPVRKQPAREPAGARRIQDALRSHFDYLTIPEEVLDSFAEDLEAGRGSSSSADVPVRKIAATFLLSTDFFQHSGDESRPLAYVAFYHPYRSPCYNPLARFDG